MAKTWFDRRNQKLFRRHYSIRRRLTIRFDLFSLGLGAVILIAMLIARTCSCGLNAAGAGGFALWFLLFLSYIPLTLLSFLDWWISGDLFQLISEWLHGDKVLLLGIFNLLTLFSVWLCVRILAAKKYGENLLRIAGHFILIFFVWGCFQLSCSLAVKVCQNGGFSGFHSGLKEKK